MKDAVNYKIQTILFIWLNSIWLRRERKSDNEECEEENEMRFINRKAGVSAWKFPLKINVASHTHAYQRHKSCGFILTILIRTHSHSQKKRAMCIN